MNENIKIYLTDKVKCHPDWSWQSSVNGWNGYHIWLVEGGRGHISVSGEEYDLMPGDVFLFDLKEDHFCTHTPENPLEVSTVYFGCEKMNRKTRLIRRSVLLAETVRQILACDEKEQEEQACLWLSALVSSFSEKVEDAPVSNVVGLACRYMDEHIKESVSLTELSRCTGYSKNQLIRLFQKEENCTPMQYFQRKKIAYAKSRLLYTNCSVSGIAEELNFCDAGYFSKVFKAQVGCSPGDFRNRRMAAEAALED